MKTKILITFAAMVFAFSAAADSFTVTRETKPGPSVTVVLLNTSGHPLEVQASEKSKNGPWFTVLYNWEKNSGTWVQIPGSERKFFRLVDLK